MNPKDIMDDAIHNFHPQYQQYTQYTNPQSRQRGTASPQSPGESSISARGGAIESYESSALSQRSPSVDLNSTD